MINLDKEIERFEKLASDYEFNLDMHQRNVMKLSVNDIERMKRNAQENRQRAEWLRELKDIKHLFSITEKLFKANFRYGVIDVVDGYDILFSEHNQLRGIFEEVNADGDSD